MNEQKEKYCMQIHSENSLDFIVMNWYILQFSK